LDETDSDPLLTVYRERREDLIRYFRIRLRSAEAAEDLVQDIYLKISRRPPDVVGNPAAFLYRLGSNLMLDKIKQERRLNRRAAAWQEVHGDPAGGETPADDPAADDAVAARQRLEKIIEVVNQLPPGVQKAFRLHKLEGLTHGETAAAMGVSRSTVEKYIMTSLKRILETVGR
jgi:RNA polymerase sigma-70 factor (ECF subfamily)